MQVAHGVCNLQGSGQNKVLVEALLRAGGAEPALLTRILPSVASVKPPQVSREAIKQAFPGSHSPVQLHR